MKARLQTPAALAGSVLTNPNITLASTHVSGVADNANALQNLQDTANGLQASRSQYGNAPGGVVSIDENTLQGLLDLAALNSFRVSEVAGGSHSSGSAHYYGLAFDIDQINGAAANSGSGLPSPDDARKVQGSHCCSRAGDRITTRTCTPRMRSAS